MARARPKALRRGGGAARIAESPAPYGQGYVVDASVVFKWFGDEEEDRPQALGLRERMSGGLLTLHAPQLLLLEVGNAWRFNRRSTAESSAADLDVLIQHRLVWHFLAPPLLRRTNALAWKYQLTFYDALYAAVAEETGLPLVTADARMLRLLAGSQLAIPLSGLGS